MLRTSLPYFMSELRQQYLSEISDSSDENEFLSKKAYELSGPQKGPIRYFKSGFVNRENSDKNKYYGGFSNTTLLMWKPSSIAYRSNSGGSALMEQPAYILEWLVAADYDGRDTPTRAISYWGNKGWSLVHSEAKSTSFFYLAEGKKAKSDDLRQFMKKMPDNWQKVNAQAIEAYRQACIQYNQSDAEKANERMVKNMGTTMASGMGEMMKAFIPAMTQAIKEEIAKELAPKEKSKKGE